MRPPTMPAIVQVMTIARPHKRLPLLELHCRESFLAKGSKMGRDNHGVDDDVEKTQFPNGDRAPPGVRYLAQMIATPWSVSTCKIAELHATSCRYIIPLPVRCIASHVALQLPRRIHGFGGTAEQRFHLGGRAFNVVCWR